MSKRITLAQAQARLDADGRGIRIVSGYSKLGANAEFECANGHRYRAIVHNVVNNRQGCMRCYKNRNVPSAAEISRRLNAHGRGMRMIGKYVNMNTKVEFACRKGHVVLARAADIINRGHGCAKCYGASRSEIIRAAMTRPDVLARTRARSRSPEARAQRSAIMKRVYERPGERERRSAAIKAAYADPEVKAKLVAAQKAAWARPGAKAKRTEKKGWNNAKRYKKLGHETIWLYIVEFAHNGQRIEKVGITTDLKRRWRRIGAEAVQVIYTESGTPEYICQRERDILRASRPYYANLPKDFTGHSECFTHVIIP